MRMRRSGPALETRFAELSRKGKKEMRADKKNESGIEYSWSGIGKLKILFRGRRNATLRFDPDTGVQGRTEAAKSVEKETILQHQEE